MKNLESREPSAKVSLADHVVEGMELHTPGRAWARNSDEGDHHKPSQGFWFQASWMTQCQRRGEKENPKNDHHWTSRVP